MAGVHFKNLVSMYRQAMHSPSIISDTMVRMPKNINYGRLISETVGRSSPVMAGVITKTTPSEKSAPRLQKVPAKEVGKTKSKKMGMVPFAGPMY